MSRDSRDQRVRWPLAIWRLARLSLNTIIATLPLGLLSLGLAVVIWATVMAEENPSVRRALPSEVPIEEVNIPRNVQATGITPQRVSVVLTGPRGAVNDVRVQDVVAQVDLSRAEEEMAGQQEATVERPIRVEVLRHRGVRGEAAPQMARVTLARQERRTVPVCVEKADLPPAGFAVEEPIAANPTEATVVGPRRNVEAVTCVAAVARLNGLTVSVTQQVPLEPRDESGRPIGSVTVQPANATLNIRVRQNQYQRQVAVDAELSGRPAPGYTVTAVRTDPATVTVVGPLDVVSSLTSIPSEPIDIEGARSDVIRAVSLQIPPGVSSGERRTVVTIVIQVTRGPGSVGVTPRVVNLAPELRATLDTPSVAVLVSGPLPEVLALTPADVSVTVDAAGLGPGVHRLEPSVTLPSGITLDGVTPNRVEITITQP